MGALHLRRDCKRNTELSIETSSSPSLARQDFFLIESSKSTTWSISLYRNKQGRPNTHCATKNGLTAMAVGYVRHTTKYGNEALQILLAQISQDEFADINALARRLNLLSGSFALTLFDKNNAYILSDQLGSISLFCDSNGNTISTSFLSTADDINTKTLNRKAAIEYILLEASHSEETVISEISLLKPGVLRDLTTGRSVNVWNSVSKSTVPNYHSFFDAVEDISATLITEFKDIANAYNSAAIALSGGFDSRLLCALSEQSGMQRQLFVFGDSSSNDVKIASEIAKKIDEPIIIINKSELRTDFPALDRTGLYKRVDFFDGTPINGALDRGEDRLTRLKQTQWGSVVLNGGGGETFRNFFRLGYGRYNLRDVCRAFYSQFPKSAFIKKTDLEDFYESLIASMSSAVCCTTDAPTRHEVEALYALFRCRYWMYRNNSIANRVGPFLTPLLSPSTIQKSIGLPLHWKSAGKLQAAIIQRISPRLASMPSAYGFDFKSGPRWRANLEIAEYTLKRPAFRPAISSLSRFRNRTNRTLQLDFDDLSIDVAPFIRSSLALEIGHTTDPGIKSRATTLKAIFDRFNLRNSPA